MQSLGRQRIRPRAMSGMPSVKAITDFADIHTHTRCGEDCIVSLPFGAEVPEKGYYSVGIHPWDSALCTQADLERIARQALLPNVIAIGECGLDALRGGSVDVQERIFRAQVDISESAGKPLIIHAVRTLNRIIELRRELRPAQRWIVHGFRGKPQLAASLLHAGIDLSFGERYNIESYNITPTERRFHETD